MIFLMSNIELFKIDLVRDFGPTAGKILDFTGGPRVPHGFLRYYPEGTNSGILQPTKGGWVPEAKMPKHQARPDVVHGFSTLRSYRTRSD